MPRRVVQRPRDTSVASAQVSMPKAAMTSVGPLDEIDGSRATVDRFDGSVDESTRRLLTASPTTQWFVIVVIFFCCCSLHLDSRLGNGMSLYQQFCIC